MSKRTVILQHLINHIATTCTAVGFRGMKFLHEINDFPAFYVHVQNESRIHESAGQKLALVNISIRAFQLTDVLDDVETLSRSIETAIQTFRPVTIEEARVTSIRTDEGLMAPYALVDMECVILYRVDLQYGVIRADSMIVTADSTIYTADRG